MRKKKQIVKDLVKAHAPLGLYELGGNSVKLYDTPKEAYLDVLQRLHSEFPKGYIDMALFISEHQHVPIREAERLCINGELYTIKMTDLDSTERADKLRQLFFLLLKTTACEFDENSFRAALFQFDLLQIKATVTNAVGEDNKYQFKDM